MLATHNRQQYAVFYFVAYSSQELLSKVRFKPLEAESNVGKLQNPEEKFLIIDGQHRLAALSSTSARTPTTRRPSMCRA